MKWKAQIGHLTLPGLTLGLIMGSLANSWSQGNVYSLNVAGYYDVSLSPGWNLIAIQLTPGINCDTGSRTNYNANSVLTGPAADGSLLYRFNPTNQSYYDAGTYFTGVGWYPLSGNTNDPVLNLPLGEGFFVWTPQSCTNAVAGEMPQGSLVNPLLLQYNLKGSMEPQAGAVTTDLFFPAEDGDVIWQCPAFSPYSYDGYDDVWYPTEPRLSVGEGFFLNTGSARTWARNFTVQSVPSQPASSKTVLPRTTVSGPLVIVSISLQDTNVVLNVDKHDLPYYNVQFSQDACKPMATWQIVATNQTTVVWKETRRPGTQGYYRLEYP